MSDVIKSPDGTMRLAPEQITKNAYDINDLKASTSILQTEVSNLSIGGNLGGGNLVRFAFTRDDGTYYQILSSYSLNLEAFTQGVQAGDFIEIMSTESANIPAYGYITTIDEELKCELTFLGDYDIEARSLNAINERTGEVVEISDFTLVRFDGTRLGDLNATERPNQIVTVLNDVDRGGVQDQYTSFNINVDDRYEWYYIGTSGLTGPKGDTGDPGGKGDPGEDGTDGLNALVCTATIVDDTQDTDPPATTILMNVNFNRTPVVGEVFKAIVRNELNSRSWIANYTVTSIEDSSINCTYFNSVENTGATGPEGVEGPSSTLPLTIHDGTYLLANLPLFSTTSEGDAYVVYTLTSGVISYQLYFHGKNGTTWTVIDNWGGEPGPAPDLTFKSVSLASGDTSYSEVDKTGDGAYTITLYLAAGEAGANFTLTDEYKEMIQNITDLQTAVLTNTNDIAALDTRVTSNEAEISSNTDKIEDLDAGKVSTYTVHAGVDYTSYHYVDKFDVNMVLSDGADYTFVNCAGTININSTFTGSLSVSGCPRLTITGISMTNLLAGATFSGCPMYRHNFSIQGTGVHTNSYIAMSFSLDLPVSTNLAQSNTIVSEMYPVMYLRQNWTDGSSSFLCTASGSGYYNETLYPIRNMYGSYTSAITGAFLGTSTGSLTLNFSTSSVYTSYDTVIKI